MNKRKTLAYLDACGVEYEVTEHKAVFNMAEVETIDLPYPELDAKNLFLRDDKKRSFYLVSVKGDKRVNLKAFRKAQGTRPLSFASADDLMDIMGLIPGAVTPLGLLNDERRVVTLFLDSDFLGHLIGVHPNDNTTTVWMRTEDLVSIIRAHGNEARVVEL